MGQRIQALDGWRGIAILLVLIDHYQCAFSSRLYWNSGQTGVQIFFVLSGYLITSQLLTSTIDLRSFYLRRAFRILPAALCYLGCLALLITFITGKIGDAGIGPALLFFRNYVPQDAPRSFTSQFWTLSIEEQFYFLWPAALVFLGKRRAAFAAAFLAIAIAAYRFTFFTFYSQYWRFAHTEIRADGLLVGCLLAILLANPRGKLWAQKWLPRLVWPAALIFAVESRFGFFLVPLHYTLCIAVMIGYTCQFCTPVNRLLEWKPLTSLGLVSYSLYIWQQLFLRAPWGWAWPLPLALAAIFSFYLVEQPMRRIGRDVAARWHHHESALTAR